MKSFILIFCFLGIVKMSFSQWTASGSDIHNSNVGNVGIGTASPGTKLHVAGNILSGLTGNAGRISLARSSDGAAVAAIANENTSGLRISTAGGSGTSYITFETASVNDAVRIIDNGNVGIGTTSPAYPFEVAKSLTSNYAARIANTNTAPGTSFGLFVNGGTNSSDYAMNVNNASNTLSLFTLTGAGYLGIGTDSPAQKLHVDGSIQSSGGAGLVLANSLNSLYGAGTVYSYISRSGGSGSSYPWNSNGTVVMQASSFGNTGGFAFITGDSPTVKMALINNGNVGIGTTTPDSKLTVAGKIHSQEVMVTTSAGADFVFAEDYKLPSLAETEKFIKQNKHLPEIASASEMVKNGIDLGEMNIKLLQKIEELTLHLIDLSKENSMIKERLLSLENKK